MKLGFIYSGKIIGNLAPGGVDPYTLKPSEHVFACDLEEGQTITTRVNPFKVKVDETSNWYPTGSPSQLNNDMYAGWFIVQVGLTPTGSTTILRLESNTKGITLDSFVDFVCSGVPQGDFSYLFKMHPATNVEAWGQAGACTNEGGFIKVKLGNVDRYLQLWQTSP